MVFDFLQKKENRKVSSLSHDELLNESIKYIPAEIRMFSGCKDEQTSADISNVQKQSFLGNIPGITGSSGGACTSAMLKVLYDDEKDIQNDLSFKEVLLQMRTYLGKKKYTQIPQLSSSRSLNMDDTFHIVPKGSEGTCRRRALCIGINYIGLGSAIELSGCHNDIKNMINYIKNVHHFEDENITILMDDNSGEHIIPTRENILNAFKKLVSESKPGDAVFFHFAGHGSKVVDLDGDEDDGYDETLVPLDFKKAGQISDDEIFKVLISPMPQGVTMTCIVDCCHSGTALDLPFVFRASSPSSEVENQDMFMGATVGYIFPHMKISEVQKATTMTSAAAGGGEMNKNNNTSSSRNNNTSTEERGKTKENKDNNAAVSSHFGPIVIIIVLISIVVAVFIKNNLQIYYGPRNIPLLKLF